MTTPENPPKTDELELWRRWRDTQDEQARQALLALHLPYAKTVAAKLYTGRMHDEFEFDEYLQFAKLALLEAMTRYDPQRGAQFRTYAHYRMNGAIISGIESLSERQRQIGLQARLKTDRLTLVPQAQQEQMQHEQQHDQQPQAKQTQIKKTQIKQMQNRAAGRALDHAEQLFRSLAETGIGLALGAILEGSSLWQPSERDEQEEQSGTNERWWSDLSYERVELKQFSQRLRSLLQHLTEREKQVIEWHYLQEMGFDEIAKKLGVSNARVSQLRHQGLQRLRKLLADK